MRTQTPCHNYHLIIDLIRCIRRPKYGHNLPCRQRQVLEFDVFYWQPLVRESEKEMKQPSQKLAFIRNSYGTLIHIYAVGRASAGYRHHKLSQPNDFHHQRPRRSLDMTHSDSSRRHESLMRCLLRLQTRGLA